MSLEVYVLPIEVPNSQIKIMIVDVDLMSMKHEQIFLRCNGFIAISLFSILKNKHGLSYNLHKKMS